ncbi:hypothetical protein BpHYR1_027256, partial [Brachionus plicatilis]
VIFRPFFNLKNSKKINKQGHKLHVYTSPILIHFRVGSSVLESQSNLKKVNTPGIGLVIQKACLGGFISNLKNNKIPFLKFSVRRKVLLTNIFIFRPNFVNYFCKNSAKKESSILFQQAGCVALGICLMRV